jgi:putative Mg2+ transporter-C (MgtC) family protein
VIRFDLISQNTLTELVSLLVAFVLSAIIGLERSRKLKSAGLRTHTLVGLGAAVFTLVSAYGFANVIGNEVVLDPSRIAAQIVSGIGFLGAGVIFVRQNVVTGLTTAASVWVTAAIGMACGAGMLLIAVAATGLHLLTVAVLSLMGRKIRTARHDDPVLVLRYREGLGVLRTALTQAGELGLEATLINTREIEKPGKPLRVETSIRLRGATPPDELLERVAELQGVSAARLVDEPD